MRATPAPIDTIRVSSMRATQCLALLAAALMLSGCAGMGEGGPPHPGAVNPYSSGGFHDAGPNYPDTGI
ncbi:hypothetical protein ACILG0_13000 [Pseudomonadota bacterium AL_CKDN230030165-1A_HGKHYDSX7]